MHKVFRPLKKGDSVRCAYMHADGSVLVAFERRNDAGTQRYYQAASTIGVRARFPERTGRLVFSSVAALLAIAGLPDPYVEVYPDGGSESTRSKGVRVVCIEVSSKAGSFSFVELPGLLSTDVHWQADVHETWETLTTYRSDDGSATYRRIRYSSDKLARIFDATHPEGVDPDSLPYCVARHDTATETH